MEFEIEQNKIDVIKEYIESNERFKSNEDLYDKFLEEVIKRGFIIFKSMDVNDSTTKIYINKIVSSSIVAVLEQEKRLNTDVFSDIDKEISSTKPVNQDTPKEQQESEHSIEKGLSEEFTRNEVENPEILSGKNEDSEKYEIKEQVVNHYGNTEIRFDFDYTPVVSGVTIKPDTLQKFYDTIVIANSEKPEKDYLQLYNLRYIQKLSIKEISDKTKMKEQDVSKSLYELMEKVRETLE